MTTLQEALRVLEHCRATSAIGVHPANGFEIVRKRIEAALSAAAPAGPTTGTISFDEAQEICDAGTVDEAIRAFADDQTNDNAVMIVRAVLALRPAAPAAEPRKPLTDDEIKSAITIGVRSGQVPWMGYEKDEYGQYTLPSLSQQHYKIARAIERAHGIGDEQ